MNKPESLEQMSSGKTALFKLKYSITGIKNKIKIFMGTLKSDQCSVSWSTIKVI